MARNYEKNFGRLNRLWLDKGAAKKLKRPKLSTLKTAAEISEWLPHLKSEMEMYLKQLEVPCYTDKKIAACNEHIRHLELEYKAFLRKLRRLDSSVTVAPWTPRPYEKRNTSMQKPTTLHPIDGTPIKSTAINSIDTPVLLLDYLYADIDSYDYTTVPEESQAILHTNNATNISLGSTVLEGKEDLQVTTSWTPDKQDSDSHDCISEKSILTHSLKIPLIGGEFKLFDPHIVNQNSGLLEKTNVLGLCYSSSDDDQSQDNQE